MTPDMAQGAARVLRAGGRRRARPRPVAGGAPAYVAEARSAERGRRRGVPVPLSGWVQQCSTGARAAAPAPSSCSATWRRSSTGSSSPCSPTRRGTTAAIWRRHEATRRKHQARRVSMQAELKTKCSSSTTSTYSECRWDRITCMIIISHSHHHSGLVEWCTCSKRATMYQMYLKYSIGRLGREDTGEDTQLWMDMQMSRCGVQELAMEKEHGLRNGLSLGIRERRQSRTRSLLQLQEQLDTAAKGTYVLGRDLDTVSHLVARLSDGIERENAMARCCAERVDGSFPVQEMVTELRRSCSSSRKLTEELEEHVCLCLATIHRARVLVITEISKQA
ncbi:hypothetical protein ABZP36_007374 [Zizania latifolia]